MPPTAIPAVAPPPGGLRMTDLSGLVRNADSCANFLKALSHEGRLMILCHLLQGPRTVTELETLLESRQAAVSQQLARLRFEGLVQARRDGQSIIYSILDQRVQDTLEILAQLFADRDGEAGKR